MLLNIVGLLSATVSKMSSIVGIGQCIGFVNWLTPRRSFTKTTVNRLVRGFPPPTFRRLVFPFLSSPVGSVYRFFFRIGRASPVSISCFTISVPTKSFIPVANKSTFWYISPTSCRYSSSFREFFSSLIPFWEILSNWPSRETDFSMLSCVSLQFSSTTVTLSIDIFCIDAITVRRFRKPPHW